MLKKSSKTMLIATIIVAIVVPLILYQPVMATETDEVPTEETMIVKPKGRAWPLLTFLKRAKPIEMDGVAIALVRNILTLDVEGEQVRVLIPPKWTTMNGEVIESEVLVDQLTSEDQTITMKALEASYENSNGFTISLILGYKIKAEGDFYAVLPFNIETVSTTS